MKKKTALTVLLCFVCAAVIGVCVIAGVSKWQQHRQELLRQQQMQLLLDDYTDRLTQAFDTLYDTESGLLARMAEQQRAGMSEREILADAIDSVRAPLRSLADIEAPENLAEAQRHFSSAADSYDTMAGEISDVLRNDTLSYSEQKSRMISLLPDALSAFDELKYGVEALEDSGVTVPESAQQLTDTLDSLVDSGMSSVLGAQ